MAFMDDNALCELSNYVFSGTWDLIGCPAYIVQNTNKRYSEINYKIQLRRKTLFFTVNLLMPCVLISFLSVLTFYLPAHAQEKVTLCISILLALIVFLLLVSRSLPPTSVTIPLISKYLFFAFVINIITIIVSVMIINVNYRSPRTYKMPRWVRIIFLNWLPILMFMTRPRHAEKYKKWRDRKIAAKIANSVSSRPLRTVMTDDGEASLAQKEVNGQVANLEMTPKGLQAVESVEYITQHLKMKDDYDEVWLQ